MLRLGKELKVVQPGKITVLRSGKNTETVELEPKEMKVLYLDFESIYPLYHKSTSKEALSRASLRAYFESNKGISRTLQNHKLYLVRSAIGTSKRCRRQYKPIK